MSLFDFIRLIYRNFLLITTIPLILAVSVWFFTRNQDKEYATSAMIYTGIASGFNIESGDNQKQDYRAINNAFDNLLLVIESRITLEEVSLRLLASHMILDEPTGGIIGPKAFQQINEFITDDLRQKALDSTAEDTYQRLNMLYKMGNPLLQDLVNKGNSYYSIKTLKEIASKRHKSSDMVEIYYSTTDPGICQQTLVILLDVFTRRYKDLKQSETGDVVAYFERETYRVKGDLSDAEDRLTDFRVKSRVINYVEETKAIAIKKQNALEEFAMKKMSLKGTEAALKEIEEKLKIRENILGKNVEVVNKKERLAEITGQLAMAQSTGIEDSLFKELIVEQEKIKRDLKKDLEILFNYTNSKEGLPSQQLLNDWLNNVVQLERDKVTVNLYQNRLNDLDIEYDRFAPMGSTIARMEREIGVYEREFLEIRHGLNMAKLRQQNIEMSSNVEVLDKPKFPQEPLPSKRGMLIIVGFMVGVMGVLGTLIAADLLDSSIRHPERAKKVTGMDVAGVLPVMEPNFEKKYGNLAEQVTGIMASKIKLDKYTLGHDGATVIGMISTRPKEGKTFAMKMIFDEMVKTGESVCLLTTQPLEEQAAHCFDYDLNDREALDAYRDQYRYILVELPAWVEGKIPVHIIENTQLLLWAMRSDMVWSTPHINMKEDLEKITKVKPTLVINGVKTHHLDQVVGEVPMQRSFVNKLVRKIVKFEFGSSGIKTEK